MRKTAAVVGVVFAGLLTATPAAATPVATNDPAYQLLGRVFPDPLATCSHVGAEPCSPNAQGNVPATQFIQWGEFLDGLEYMNTNTAEEWSRYMEVLVLDGKLGENGQGQGPSDDELDVGSKPGSEMFPGNNQPLEFDPKPEYRSVGLPTSTVDRKRSDLITVRVTDESVPDAGKKRYALSLSIHGIERAGAEGGTRAIEDLVTAFTTEKADEPVVPESVDPNAPTFAEVLRETIIYFTYPNPDGWRRGSLLDDVNDPNGPGVFFQRYNGNGVDLNRDWPDIGFSFRPYSGLSEPESRALAGSLTEIQESTGSDFAAGDDLHGQPFADALSYTLLPHGRHDFDKNERIRETSIAIHRASEEALLWSPIVQPNDAPQGGGAPCEPTPLGDVCAQIYGQTWGTVYDTINYTTTGALGDWFDSSVGLGADGIDNEMSFSHLDRNIVFDPHTEQLHVDGNKALIYAHLATILDPAEGTFDALGTKGYVPNERLARAESEQDPAPDGTEPQADITAGPQPDGGGETVFPIEVKQGPQPEDGSADAGKNIFNGGMRVDITEANAQGIATGNLLTTLKVQCRGCEDGHAGDPNDEGWITVAEDYNQSFVYLQSGLTAAVNRPQGLRSDGKTPVEWRALIEGPVGAARMDVDFTSGPATVDGNTNGDPPPKLHGYDVANTDYFEELNPDIPGTDRDFGEVDPRAVIAGEQSLSGLDSLVLADDLLPGYTGTYGPPITAPTTQDFEIRSETATIPGARQPEYDAIGSRARVPGTYEVREFEISPDEANKSMTVQIQLEPDNGDFDLYLYRVTESGDEALVQRSTTSTSGERITVGTPEPGTYRIYVDNWLALENTDWFGTVTFEGYPEDTGGDTGSYTEAEKAAWVEELRQYVRDGGNLVLTDGALLALPDLVEGISRLDVAEQTVYVGQVAFSDGTNETVDDPLAKGVAQEGARFNTGMRRQTFEPTPLGFAIQNESGGDQAFARQYDVDAEAWDAVGGRFAAGSADSGARDAQAVYDRVALGELPLGEGQIRILGALLPQPSQEFNHTFGIEPYATTYTGYILMRNLLEVEPSASRAPPPSGGGGGGTGDGAGGTGGGGDAGGGDGGDGGGDGGAPAGDEPKPAPPAKACERGDRRPNVLRGGRRDDCLAGGRGDDRLKGRRGDDKLRGGRGDDRLNGGPGADTLRCGRGRDVAVADRRDKVRGCEKVK